MLYMTEVEQLDLCFPFPTVLDRESTRLNSSHLVISYAVFCLKKKKIQLCIFKYEHTQHLHEIPRKFPPKETLPYNGRVLSHSHLLPAPLRHLRIVARPDTRHH